MNLLAVDLEVFIALEEGIFASELVGAFDHRADPPRGELTQGLDGPIAVLRPLDQRFREGLRAFHDGLDSFDRRVEALAAIARLVDRELRLARLQLEIFAVEAELAGG